jgi:ribosome-associated translation inhibitor RaiA
MISPLQIEFQNTQPTEAVESRIRQELAEFERFYNRLVSCRVEVEAPEHERRGGLCKVRVDFGLPPEDATAWAELRGLAVKQGADHLEIKAKRKDASMAVHAAFNVARRRLKDFVGVGYKRP